MAKKKKQNFIDKAVSWVKGKKASNLKANYEGYDQPLGYSSVSSEKEIYPDISYKNKRGGKTYTEIALKRKDKQKLVTRWKLLSTMAKLKKGKLFLLAPRGHKMFTKRLVDKYEINATVNSLK